MAQRETIDGETLEEAAFIDLVEAAGPTFIKGWFGSEEAWPAGTYETTADSDPSWVMSADGEGTVTFRIGHMGPFTLPVQRAVEIITVAEAEQLPNQG